MTPGRESLPFENLLFENLLLGNLLLGNLLFGLFGLPARGAASGQFSETGPPGKQAHLENKST